MRAAFTPKYLPRMILWTCLLVASFNSLPSLATQTSTVPASNATPTVPPSSTTPTTSPAATYNPSQFKLITSPGVTTGGSVSLDPNPPLVINGVVQDQVSCGNGKSVVYPANKKVFVLNCAIIPVGGVIPPTLCMNGATEITTVCGITYNNFDFLYEYGLHQGEFMTPPPFAPQPYTMQCVVKPDMTAGWFLTSAGINCTKPQASCPAANFSVCGAEFTAPAGTNVGNNIQVPIPASSLIPAGANENYSVSASCVVENDGQPYYQIGDTQNISCNYFPCQAANVDLCGTSIPIPGGAALGETANFAMPPPFKPDPFIVQCLGTNAQAPTYEVIDASSVSCSQTGGAN